MSDHQSDLVRTHIFERGGNAGAILKSINWSTRPIGPVAAWPPGLKSAVKLCLASRYPICILWGKECTYFYNDAYTPILGAKHPWALGNEYPKVWPEIWESDIRPLLESVKKTGQASWSENILLVLHRFGFNEECYFQFSFTPIEEDDDGVIGGVFTAITETTPQLVRERRLRTLRDIGTETSNSKSAEDSCKIAGRVVRENSYDIPFALFYLLDANENLARLAETVGINADHPAAIDSISLSSAREPTSLWRLSEAVDQNHPLVIEDFTTRFGPLQAGPWPERVEKAVVLALSRPGQSTPYGFLIAGVSPRRSLDAEYLSFLSLVASQVATAISNAVAYQEERKRAEALAELDRAKTQFFSNISHEFRTPLSLILGRLEDELAQPDPDLGRRERLEAAHRNSLRLLRLVNTLLDFSRIEAGRIQASYEPTDLGVATAELASIFRSAIEKAGMKLIVDCPPLTQLVYVDRDMWEKIVLNLMSNAFKFTFVGEIRVTIRESQRSVVLSIEDTGIGIAEGEIPKVFDRFYRIEGAKGRTYEGTGIGLALVQELVKLHGGTVDVNSGLGKGTEFIVTLPLGVAHLPKDRISLKPAPASTALRADSFLEEAMRWLPDSAGAASEENSLLSISRTTGESQLLPKTESPLLRGKERLLVADDNADMRDYLRRILSRNYMVFTASHGEAALKMIHTEKPDLVVLDIMMPNLDGLQVLQRLRSTLATQSLPVILLSARAGEESRVEGLEAGADDYLVKPFSTREFLATVEAHLKIARVRREAELHNSEILESISDCFLTVDHEWRFTYVNVHAEHHFGFKRDEMIGRGLWEKIPQALGTRFEEQLRKALSEQVSVHFEVQSLFTRKWIELHAYPSVHGLSIYFRNIHDRKVAEENLRRSEARLAHFFDVSPDLMVIAGLDGKFRKLNLSWEHTLGWTIPELCAVPWIEFVHPEDKQSTIAAAQQLREGQKVIGFVNRYRCKDGVYRWIEWHAASVIAEDLIYAVARDITERKKAQEYLEKVVDERTAKLRDSLGELEAFSYSISHDMRAPLRAMQGFSKAVLEDYGDKLETDGKNLLERIAKGAQRLDLLIQDVLAYSRVAKGDFQMQPIELDKLVPEVIQSFEFKSADVIIENPLHPVMGHEALISQIISNLVGNAIKFTPPERKPQVRLRTVKEGEKIRLWVEDNGIGIDPSHFKRIFEIFGRVYSDKAYEGTGIGLAIVKKAVDRLGGQAGVESGVGKGSRFWITLNGVPESVQDLPDANTSS